jgi:hypothetical protein
MTEKAKYAQVQLGSITIEGIMLPNGTFGMTLAQLNELVPFDPYTKNLARTLKRFCGKSLTLTKIVVDRPIQKPLEYIITIDQLSLVLVKLALRGYESAEDFAAFLVGLSLEKLFSDAFEVKSEQDQRQGWLVERIKGRKHRLDLTDGILWYIGGHKEMSVSEKKFLFTNCTNRIYRALFGKTADTLKEERGDSMTQDELGRVATLERHAAVLMMKKDMHPMDAVQDAIDFYC